MDLLACLETFIAERHLKAEIQSPKPVVNSGKHFHTIILLTKQPWLKLF